MAEFCTQCGKELLAGTAFCTECGAKISASVPAVQPVPVQYAAVQPASREPAVEHAVSTGTFFGLIFLFSIPVIGWLACIVMTFAPKNKNLKHFAQAMLIWLIIGMIATGLIGLGVKALVRTAAPYVEQIVQEGSEVIGEAGDLGELSEVFGQLDSITGMMEEIQNMLPETLPAE